MDLLNRQYMYKGVRVVERALARGPKVVKLRLQWKWLKNIRKIKNIYF